MVKRLLKGIAKGEAVFIALAGTGCLMIVLSWFNETPVYVEPIGILFAGAGMLFYILALIVNKSP